MSQDYLQEMRLMLQAFEHTQLLMLRCELQRCVEEFEIEIEQISAALVSMEEHLMSNRAPDKRIHILLTNQIQRLLKFLKEMHSHCGRLAADQSPSGIEVIFIFERQHIFKNILRKHLSDYTKMHG